MTVANFSPRRARFLAETSTIASRSRSMSMSMSNGVARRGAAAHFTLPSSGSRGGTGRRVRLRTVWGNPWRFESSREQSGAGRAVLKNAADANPTTFYLRSSREQSGAGRHFRNGSAGRARCRDGHCRSRSAAREQTRKARDEKVAALAANTALVIAGVIDGSQGANFTAEAAGFCQSV